MNKKTVVIGFLGTQLDSGMSARRWDKWRPTVSVTQQPDRPVDRIELFYAPQHETLAKWVVADIAQVSPHTQVNLVLMPLANPWDFDAVYTAVYDWARTYPFDLEKEQYWAHITTGTHVAQICMFLMVEAHFIPGVLLQTAPPPKSEPKGAGRVELIDLDLSRYDRIAQRFNADREDALTFLKSGIATRNTRFNAMIEEIERIAVRSKAPVLLVGPTGAGKSFLARKVYELKKARHQVSGEFVEVNCATLRGDGAASTLFGHKKGAFTGAVVDRSGLLRLAHKGVLFLDEIGELGMDEQAMLLKAIEEKRFLPVGADHEVQSEFQLIAGTNRDLRKEVAAGHFREDLFARINLWTYVLPGLSERVEDIEPNVDYLLTLVAQDTGRKARFNVEAKKCYFNFAQSAEACWLGNFRDLTASIARMATLADGGRITVELVDAEIQRLQWMWHRPDGMAEKTGRVDVEFLQALLGEEAWAQTDLFDRMQLQSVVAVCRQSKTLSEAGRKLFNATREQRAVVNDADRLRKYLQKFGLSWKSVSA